MGCVLFFILLTSWLMDFCQSSSESLGRDLGLIRMESAGS